ncbi:F-type H+-transporting ATPase subunit b [Methylacidimicrobium cyclopophantes]|uniref:ATP synthase subunit b n=1 Tax=Methylacidimicrobium cyclopophantes TaxID=1041766 RepID=A0A5E6MAI3_9BACT|nr:F0F1 ATP synthase subunit B [Methylacidimicrobium cyclopophantes]VVM04764.1 F-type H+-transporting ATPase subunit b [Methylacidimicrobium cyclopophantes]
MQEALAQLGVDWPRFIAQTINFAIVLWVLNRFAYRPVLRLLAERRTRIAESLQNAERIQKELAAAEEARREILQKANEQAARLIAEAEQAARQQGERLLKEAAAEAERIVQKARERAEQEQQESRAMVRREVGELVLALTAKVSGKVLSPEDQERLRAETVAQLPSSERFDALRAAASERN